MEKLVLCDNLDNAIYRDTYRVIVIKIINFLLSIIVNFRKLSQAVKLNSPYCKA